MGGSGRRPTSGWLGNIVGQGPVTLTYYQISPDSPRGGNILLHEGFDTGSPVRDGAEVTGGRGVLVFVGQYWRAM